MKVYDGASWITATSAGATSLIRFRYVATSGQTTFSGADAASATLTYTVNNITVCRNGVTLDTSEYTASNGTSVVLTVAAGTGDIVDITAFKSFTVGDALSTVSGGTVNGAVTVTGALTANGNVVLGDASTDTLNVGNGGLVKDASGNVGIGTTSPTNGKLVITGNSVTTAQGIRLTGDTADARFICESATLGAGILGTFSTHAQLFYTDSTERMRIDSSGNVLINTTTNPGGSAKLGIKGAGATNATVSLYMINSASTALVLVYDDGGFYSGLAAASPYNNTTATGANAVFAANGFMQRSTSSLKYKKDVQDATHGLADVLKLRSVTYKGKNDGDIIFGGLIAEEVDAAGLNEFVQYAADGSPDALNYGNMVALLTKAIQEQQALITSLTARITALENT
jgi:hypothetical protein